MHVPSGRSEETLTVVRGKTMAIQDLRAEQALAVGQATLNRDQISVFLALGGGWQ